MGEVVEVIVVLAGALFAGGVGGLLGVELALRRAPRPAPVLEAVCSCGHGYGKHRHDGCGGTTTVRREWNTFDGMSFERNHYEDTILECGCVHYDGPDPETVRMIRGA